ncbi:hypothetical protein Ddye_023030 [Dipteronia dyeriana]|uniref:Reverse transcriptase n=1 Tax=Dipteronia dyeriana TaxID=168575 RepID=A0AAD9WSY4_9ROSI|nr:hypothetical protein Ddye_023030 [Dipteronia dyeriana]
MINQRRKKTQISRMVLSNGTTLDDAESVHFGAARYFRDFFSTSCEVVQADLSILIDPVISDVENNMFCAELIEMEVKEALFSIPQQSCPGPDGFRSGFYIKCWEIIKGDVIDAAREFFRGGLLTKFFTSPFIVLIPKVPDPSSFNKFRPISLCSVAYKIFSKIIVACLTRVIQKLVLMNKVLLFWDAVFLKVSSLPKRWCAPS